MKTPTLILLVLLAASATNPVFAGATSTIAGVVTDARTGLPIPGARVMVLGTDLGAMVNPNTGQYRIGSVSLGEHFLECSRIGYIKRTVAIVIDSSYSITECDFALIPDSFPRYDSVMIITRPILDERLLNLSEKQRKGVGSISGTVMDSETGVFIPGAKVSIEGKSIVATTDMKSGKFSINNVPVGLHSLKANSIGYHVGQINRITVLPDENIELLFLLTNSTIHEPFDSTFMNREVGTIRGKVVDKSNKPFVSAFVKIKNTNIEVVSDSLTGNYIIRNILPNKYEIMATCSECNSNSKSVSLKAKETKIVDFKL